jgi:hypothetical protein
MKTFSRKCLGVAIAVLVLASVTFAAAAEKPKATGDADFINAPGFYDQQANLTFNAINTKVGELDAKGSAIYTDANVTYTMDVQFLKVSGTAAWIAGPVTSATFAENNPGCCIVGNWIFYKVVDNGEPGTLDQIWGEDLTAGEGITTPTGAYNKVFAAGPGNPQGDPQGGPFVLNGGNIQVH